MSHQVSKTQSFCAEMLCLTATVSQFSLVHFRESHLRRLLMEFEMHSLQTLTSLARSQLHNSLCFGPTVHDAQCTIRPSLTKWLASTGSGSVTVPILVMLQHEKPCGVPS